MKKKILKDLVRYVPQAVVPALIAFVSVPVYTRFFAPAAYGNLNLVRVAVNLLEKGSSWIGTSLTRYYGQYEKEDRLSLLLTTVVKTNLLVALLVTAPVFLALALIDIAPELRLLFQIGAVLFSLNLLKRSLSNVLRMQRRINMHSAFVLIASVFSFLISLALIFFLRMGIEAILVGHVLILAAVLPFLWRVSARGLFQAKIGLDIGILKRFASYGVPLTVGILGMWILDLSDRFLIKAMLDSHAVGVYSACYNVTWNSLFLIVNLFFMMEEPLAMKTFAGDGAQALREFIHHETRLYLIVMVPCVVWICRYADFLFSFMVGEEYRGGIVIVPYVAVSVLISGLIYKLHLGLLAMERTKTIMGIVTVSGLANVLANMALIPRMGILGAAVATLLSYMLYLTLMVLATMRFFRWPFPFLSLARVTGAALLSIVFLPGILARSDGTVKMLSIGLYSLSLYGAFLLILREVTMDELALARHSIVGRARKGRDGVKGAAG